MITRMAVIPARAGSTRLKNKNFLELGGIPLIGHTIEAVMYSDCFDKIVVSTDSKEIKKIAKGYGVDIHHRQAEHATTQATVLEAMLDLMKHNGDHDIFAYFLPTCPFRDAQHINDGVRMLDSECDTVVSVTKYSEPPQLAMVEGYRNQVIPVFDNLTSGITNSKYFTQYLKPNGGMYIGWWKKILEDESFFKGRVRGYEMDKISSLDINDEIDLQLAELVYNARLSRD